MPPSVLLLHDGVRVSPVASATAAIRRRGRKTANTVEGGEKRKERTKERKKEKTNEGYDDPANGLCARKKNKKKTDRRKSALRVRRGSVSTVSGVCVQSKSRHRARPI